MIQSKQLNEQTYEFSLDKAIAEAAFEVKTPQEAVNSPLAKKLFGFPWTESLKIDTRSLQLTKKDWVDWDILLEPLQGLLEEHFTTTTALEKAPTPAGQNTSGSEAAQIKEFIEGAINPSLAMHGGYVELVSFENNIAYMSMGGGCQGCASSQMTMIEGIETALKERFPFVERIMDVTDHSQGENPYM